MAEMPTMPSPRSFMNPAGGNSLAAAEAKRAVSGLATRRRAGVSSIATYDFAHELNNFLAIISGYSEICATNPSIDPEQFRNYLNEIREAARGASELARQLLLFSRKPGFVVAAEPAPAKPAQTKATPAFPRGHESVLVVEDEEVLREMLGTILKQHGYRPTLAGDGSQAAKVFVSSPQSFDVVLLDLQLPGLSGLEVLSKIRQAQPKQRIIAVSGNVSPEAEDVLRRQGVDNHLHKPYHLEELGRSLRQVLATAA